MKLIKRVRVVSIAIVAVAVCSCSSTNIRAQEVDWVTETEDVLARGPLHEAFAAPVVFDPLPGMLISRVPPEPVEELPPEYVPDGENVVWIDGYWSWDDEDDDFVWVSGIWRDVPPDREWVPGYWLRTPNGAQWVSGFWKRSEVEVVEYYPTPPASIEIGPSSEPPTPAHSWIPGSWIWRESRYVWRPGYWIVYEPDWVWVPQQYIWTPRGCVLVEGYWDYAPAYRGVVFAPVRFQRVVYSERRYVYTPRVVIDVNVAVNHCFARPRVRHYYFGDYYARQYVSAGIYPSFSFHYSRYGYDPLYARELAVHRRTNPKWELSVRAEFSKRRAEPDRRPPRRFSSRRADAGGSSTRITIAKSLDEVVQKKEGVRQFAKVSNERRSTIRQDSRVLQESRGKRVQLESRGSTAKARPERDSLPAYRPPGRSANRQKSVGQAPRRPQPPSPEPETKARPTPRRPEPRERIQSGRTKQIERNPARGRTQPVEKERKKDRP